MSNLSLLVNALDPQQTLGPTNIILIPRSEASSFPVQLSAAPC